MGHVARQRARSWLIATSLLLTVVSVLVIYALLWMLFSVRQNGAYVVTDDVRLTVTRLDLLVSGLIGAAVLALGQAIVSYEIFTGKTLPRRGLRRQWRLIVLLAASYGLLVGAILAIRQRPVYGVRVSALFMTAFFAFLSWRAYTDRARYIEHLRPFVRSQHLYDHLIDRQETAAIDAAQPFDALCGDVLGARPGFSAAHWATGAACRQPVNVSPPIGWRAAIAS